MYLVKEVWESTNDQYPKVINGLRIVKREKSEAREALHFCLKTDIYFGEFADFSKIPKYNKLEYLLTYVNQCEMKGNDCDSKEIYLHIDSYQPENKEGYIIFCGNTFRKPKTNGQKIFEYGIECVIMLKDGEYLELGDSRLEVINKQLVMFV